MIFLFNFLKISLRYGRVLSDKSCDWVGWVGPYLVHAALLSLHGTKVGCVSPLSQLTFSICSDYFLSAPCYYLAPRFPSSFQLLWCLIYRASDFDPRSINNFDEISLTRAVKNVFFEPKSDTKVREIGFFEPKS